MKCIKCGSERRTTVYTAERPDYDIGYYTEDKERDEHLRHRCENCRYAWNTPTLDSPQPERKS